MPTFFFPTCYIPHIRISQGYKYLLKIFQMFPTFHSLRSSFRMIVANSNCKTFNPEVSTFHKNDCKKDCFTYPLKKFSFILQNKGTKIVRSRRCYVHTNYSLCKRTQYLSTKTWSSFGRLPSWCVSTQNFWTYLPGVFLIDYSYNTWNNIIFGNLILLDKRLWNTAA